MFPRIYGGVRLLTVCQNAFSYSFVVVTFITILFSSLLLISMQFFVTNNVTSTNTK